MPYFSRLTDIVTCNLSAIVADAADPRQALLEILAEMQEGVAGAHRSMKTARDHELRIQAEMNEQSSEVSAWEQKAREFLAAGGEADARQALLRKREVVDLLAGLEQQRKSAVATREHLETMFRALEARQADAQRRLAALDQTTSEPMATVVESVGTTTVSPSIASEIDDELAALKRQLSQ